MGAPSCDARDRESKFRPSDTCRSGIRSTKLRASGANSPAPPSSPGTSTSTCEADRLPNCSTRTRSYRAGPGRLPGPQPVRYTAFQILSGPARHGGQSGCQVRQTLDAGSQLADHRKYDPIRAPSLAASSAFEIAPLACKALLGAMRGTPRAGRPGLHDPLEQSVLACPRVALGPSARRTESRVAGGRLGWPRVNGVAHGRTTSLLCTRNSPVASSTAIPSRRRRARGSGRIGVDPPPLEYGTRRTVLPGRRARLASNVPPSPATEPATRTAHRRGHATWTRTACGWPRLWCRSRRIRTPRGRRGGRELNRNASIPNDSCKCLHVTHSMERLVMVRTAAGPSGGTVAVTPFTVADETGTVSARPGRSPARPVTAFSRPSSELPAIGSAANVARYQAGSRRQQRKRVRIFRAECGCEQLSDDRRRWVGGQQRHVDIQNSKEFRQR